jgi:hypothetical protein
MEQKRIATYLSCGAIGLAVIHILWPGLGIDSITISLIVVAALPWLLPLLKTVELPGGFKIELKDTKAATDKVTSRFVELKGQIKAKSRATGGLSVKKTDPFPTLRRVAEYDPNLALVGFRIEVEKRLLGLAEKNGIRTERVSLARIVGDLQEKEILPVSAASGLSDLIGLGNRAAHGVRVEPEAAAWVMDVGPSILDTLEPPNEEANNT